ncbi:MAG: DUF3800 domain-containing protein [bacterium]|nr:DUF3800 domain-containing protein [bacterium]
MLVFVDESGDPGVVEKDGSSEYFVVTLVIFEDNDEAEDADRKIDLIRKELSLPTNFEFHFYNNHPKIRKYFLEKLCGYNFFYFGIIINKRELCKSNFQSGSSFYKYATRLVFENAKPYLRNATVIFDRSGGSTFQSQLKKYIKGKINIEESSDLIKKVKTEHSKGNNLLQLTDMICGSLARALNKSKSDSQVYRNIIRFREIFVGMWPK